jgi:hypothetical protein
MFLPLTDLVCHVNLTMGPDVRNPVKPAKNANQCTLQRILVKLVVFCNFAEYRWFCVFPAQMWWFFGINSIMFDGIPATKCVFDPDR